MKKVFLLLLVILSLVIAPVANASELQFIERDGRIYTKVCDLTETGSVPYTEDDIIRYNYPEDLGYVVDGAYWLPMNDWYLKPEAIMRVFSTGVVHTCGADVVSGEAVGIWISDPVKQNTCPICGHKKHKKRKKSHYKWCPRHPRNQ